jgi:diamine N-acetyltransferase
MVSFRDVTSANVSAIVGLTDPDDEGLMAPNDLSIIEWLLRDDAWLRAIYVDGTPVGLVMMQDIPDWHIYAVWRLMIGRQYRGNGFGRNAMEQVIERYKHRPGAYVLTTFVAEKEGNAEDFYRKLGFERDGRRQMNQIGMALRWADPISESAWPSVPDDAEITLDTVRSGMLRTVKRPYLSLPEEQREGLESPWMTIIRYKLDRSRRKAKAICANGYPIGFAFCDAHDDAVGTRYVAVPYQGTSLEARLSSLWD